MNEQHPEYESFLEWWNRLECGSHISPEGQLAWVTWKASAERQQRIAAISKAEPEEGKDTQ